MCCLQYLLYGKQLIFLYLGANADSCTCLSKWPSAHPYCKHILVFQRRAAFDNLSYITKRHSHHHPGPKKKKKRSSKQVQQEGWHSMVKLILTGAASKATGMDSKCGHSLTKWAHWKGFSDG